MTTQRIDIPVDLFAQLEAKAQAEGKAVDELASEALTAYASRSGNVWSTADWKTAANPAP